jgi:hypothetical protein
MHLQLSDSMCDVIEYVRAGERMLVYFDMHHPELPIRRRGGTIDFVTWGTRGDHYLNDDNTPGYLLKFPVGGRATRASILCGGWEKFEPRPVRIVASRFALAHPQLGPVFFALGPGEYIQGLLAQSGAQRRVYIVTVDAPAEHSEHWSEWPRMVTSRQRAL